MKPQFAACSAALGAIVLAAMPLLAVQQQSNPAPPPKAALKHQRSAQSEGASEEGDRIFEQNCARCHNTPNGFSTRISGTIVQHMRVRANLSQHDAELLLHYFNP
jgi:cytochrome c5